MSSPSASKTARERGQVVIGHRDDRLGDRLGDAPTPGQADRVLAVAKLAHVVGQDADQGVVVDAVVLALELDDLRPAGVAPGDPHRVHRGLGARDGHPDHLHPAGDLLDQLAGPDLVLARQREADAPAHPLVDVVIDALVRVAEHDRAITHPQVDVLVLVQIPDPATLAPIDVDRVLAPRPEVRVGAAGHRLQGALVERGLPLALEGRSRADGGFGGHESLRAGAPVTSLRRSGGTTPRCDRRDGCPIRGTPHGTVARYGTGSTPECHGTRAPVNTIFAGERRIWCGIRPGLALEGSKPWGLGRSAAQAGGGHRRNPSVEDPSTSGQAGVDPVHREGGAPRGAPPARGAASTGAAGGGGAPPRRGAPPGRGRRGAPRGGGWGAGTPGAGRGVAVLTLTPHQPTGSPSKAIGGQGGPAACSRIAAQEDLDIRPAVGRGGQHLQFRRRRG